MEIRHQIDPADYQRFMQTVLGRAHAHAAARMSWWLRWRAELGLWLLAAAGAAGLARMDRWSLYFRECPEVIALYIMLFLAARAYLAFHRNASVTAPLENGPVLGPERLRLTEKGIECEKMYFRQETDWEGVIDFYEDEDYFYVFIDTVMAHIISKSAFARESDKDAFRQTIVERIRENLRREGVTLDEAGAP
jgi:hypothetical protein